MDKYEYNLKLDQMKSLFAEERYEEAAELADTVNWNKVKNPSALLRAGEVYEKAERYESSRDVLLMAYDRSPIGRAIIYRLAEVAIRMEDFQAAQDYYDEFVEIAPHDNLKYALRYDIRKAQGASYSELVPILEELKEQEYTEEWAYELAYLYHKAGRSEKCIDACDELILWFGDGPYVERALELKMLYMPLSKAQEDKYRQFRQAKDGYTHIEADDFQRSGEFARGPVAIPSVEVSTERYNTVNLQEEIMRGMQEIRAAKEKSAVEDSLDNINKIVEDIPYLKLPKEEPEGELHIETDEEIDGALKLSFQELLGEDSDGQIRMVVDDHQQIERQITGQITIEEVLEEWERTKRAAEAALQEAEQRKLESAKARALQQAEGIINRLNDVSSKLNAGVTSRELMEEYMQEHSAPEPSKTAAPDEVIVAEEVQNGPGITTVEDEISLPVIEEPDLLKELFEEETTSEPSAEESVPEPSPEGSVPEPSEEETALESFAEKTVSELSAEETMPEPFAEPTPVGEPEISVVSEEAEPTLVGEPEISVASQEAEPEIPKKPKDTEVLRQDTQVKKAAEKNKTERWRPKTIRMPKIPELTDLGVSDSAAEPDIIEELTDEQKKIFSYFIPIKGMEDQLCKALTGVRRRLTQEGSTAASGNLIIQGGQGSGKTTLATSIIKVLQQETGRPNDKIGKIHAEALNSKDVGNLIRKVAGGCLIIEQAGELERKTIVALSLLMEQDSSGLLVILEDTSKGIKKALAQDETFAKKFTETVKVPIFNNDQLVAFAKSYSKELGYEIDEMAVLALYKRISSIQTLDQATTITEVKDIVDEAIEREAHGGMKKFFSILTASRYTDDDCIVLNEKDFE